MDLGSRSGGASAGEGAVQNRRRAISGICFMIFEYRRYKEDTGRFPVLLATLRQQPAGLAEAFERPPPEAEVRLEDPAVQADQGAAAGDGFQFGRRDFVAAEPLFVLENVVEVGLLEV